MAYKKKIYRFRNAIEVEENHSGRYGAPGQIRQKKRKPTPEQIEKINQRNKEKRCRRKLRAHFRQNDYFTTITYDKVKRPGSMQEAKEDFAIFIREVRKEYKKRGEQLRWIRNIETGTKGAWHAHIVLNRIPDTDIIIREAWKKGRVVSALLYEQGEFRDLAAYMTKSPVNDKSIRESSYSTSRNIPDPEPEEKIMTGKTWREPRPPKGYYLDKESMIEGINPVTGYKYRSYTFLKIKEVEKWKKGREPADSVASG